MGAIIYDGIETNDKYLVASLLAAEDLLRFEDLDTLWAGIRDPNWEGEELLRRKKEWLESRVSFYSDKRWRQYSWKKSLRRETKGAIEDFLYFLDTKSSNSCHVKMDYHQLYCYYPTRVNFIKLWEKIRQDNEQFILRCIVPRVEKLTIDEITNIWSQWADLAEPLNISINPESPYGLYFREKICLSDQGSLDLLGGRKKVLCINREIQSYNSFVREFSAFIEWILSGSEDSVSSLVSGGPCSILPFYRWKRNVSKELYFSANSYWNCDMPKLDKETHDTRPYLEWKEKNPEEARIWMNETDKALCRALWNLEHPDDPIIVLYEPNYCSIESLTVF